MRVLAPRRRGPSVLTDGRVALTQPFVLLPFRPDSDTTAARSFIRNYFGNVARLGRGPVQDEALNHELRLIEPVVCSRRSGPGYVSDCAQELCCILKWCWSRLPGGVVTWEAYELFKVGEHGMPSRRRFRAETVLMTP